MEEALPRSGRARLAASATLEASRAVVRTRERQDMVPHGSPGLWHPRKRSLLSAKRRQEVLDHLVEQHQALTDAEIEMLDAVFDGIYTAQRAEVWKMFLSRRLGA